MAGAVDGVVGLGVDIVDIERFAGFLERRKIAATRLFTEAEMAHAARRTNPAAFLAARFAAKEATLKALGLGLGEMRFAEIEVVRHESGRPELRLHAKAAATAASMGARRWLVSLSHTHNMAQATVLALSN